MLLPNLNRFGKIRLVFGTDLFFFILIFKKKVVESSSRGTYLEHIGIGVEDGWQAPAADIRLCLDVQVVVPHFDLGQLNPYSEPQKIRRRKEFCLEHLALFYFD